MPSQICYPMCVLMEIERKIGKKGANITNIEFYGNIFHKISGTFCWSKGCDF